MQPLTYSCIAGNNSIRIIAGFTLPITFEEVKVELTTRTTDDQISLVTLINQQDVAIQSVNKLGFKEMCQFVSGNTRNVIHVYYRAGKNITIKRNPKPGRERTKMKYLVQSSYDSFYGCCGINCIRPIGFISDDNQSYMHHVSFKEAVRHLDFGHSILRVAVAPTPNVRNLLYASKFEAGFSYVTPNTKTITSFMYRLPG